MKSFGLFAGALLVAAGTGFAADITGKVTLKGTPPPEKELPLDPQTCGKLRTDKPTTRFYVVGSGGELSEVFVYLKNAPAKEASGSSPTLDQVGCEYVPYVLGAQAKQKITVKNSDPLMHNVHPQPIVTGNKEVNMAQPAKGKDLEFKFDMPEVFVKFKCDVHPWMFAYVGVVENPYFAVTGKDGTFKIANVPPGKYQIEAVHRKSHPNGKGIVQEITVGPDGGKADFTVELAK